MRAYEALKRKHLSLLREIKSLEKEMRDYGSDYQALIELVQDFGLDLERLSNVDAIVPKLLREWKGRREALHLFIALIEKAREKKQIESQLEKYRLDSQKK